MLLIHGGDDGVGAAHRLVSDGDGLAGLNICEAVVINYLQNFHLIQAGNRLGSFIVIYQYHPLAPWAQQMEAGQSSHYFLVFIQNRVTAIAAGKQGLLYIVQIIAEVKTYNALCVAKPHDGHCLIYEPGGLAGVQGRGDDACVSRTVLKFRGNFRLADYKTGHLSGKSGLYHFRLIAADKYTVIGEHGTVGKTLGYGYLHLAGDGIGSLGKLIYQIALQHTYQIEQRQLIHVVFIYRAQVIGGHVSGRQNAVKCAVVVQNRDCCYLAVAH